MRHTLLAIALLVSATSIHAGISSITAHGVSFSRDETIPLFVEAGTKNSLIVKGQFMDLCTGVESSDASFDPSIGRRVMGSNSSVEIKIDASSAPDADGATIHIKFAAGEETFKVKAFKTRITGFDLNGRTSASCVVGETVLLEVQGSVEFLGKSTAGAMIDVADARFELGAKDPTSTPGGARFPLKCTAEGTFTVKKDWFKDTRVRNDAADEMVRGSATFAVTVHARPPLIRKPVS